MDSIVRMLVAQIPMTVLALIIGTPHPARADKTYYIDNSTDYDSNGCPDYAQYGPLPASLTTLETHMKNKGFTGHLYFGPSVWPQDWIESCSSSYGSGGVDHSWGDGHAVSIIYTHGSPGHLMFGYPRYGTCDVYFQQNMRLGSMSNGAAKSAVAIYLACEVLKRDELQSSGVLQQRTRQQLGFSTPVYQTEIKLVTQFFDDTVSKPNYLAWLDKYNYAGAGQSAIVVSTGDNYWLAINNMVYPQLATGNGLDPRGGGPAHRH